MKGDLALLVTGLVVSGLGIGPMGALGSGLAMGSVPMEKAGNAASMNQISGDFGIAMGVALIGLTGTSIYQHQVVIPDGVPADAAGTVHESVAGAYLTASTLPDDVAAQVIVNANDAFATALNIAAVGSAVLAVVLAFMSSTLLRHVPPTGQAPSPDAAPGEDSDAGDSDAGDTDTADTPDTPSESSGVSAPTKPVTAA